MLGSHIVCMRRVLAAHLRAPVVAAEEVDGHAQPGPEAAEVRVQDDVLEHPAPLVHLRPSHTLTLLSCLHGPGQEPLLQLARINLHALVCYTTKSRPWQMA